MGYLPKLIFATCILGLCNMVKGAPNTNVTTVLCNTGIYTKGDPFATSLAYILNDLEAVTPLQKDHDYRNISPYPNAFAYGHATCKATLSDADCSTCIQAAAKLMLSSCDRRIGARADLYDCGIRYEQYPFAN